MIQADDLIKAEMLNILEHDVNGKTIDDFNLTSLSAAASVIDNEIKAVSLFFYSIFYFNFEKNI